MKAALERYSSHLEV